MSDEGRSPLICRRPNCAKRGQTFLHSLTDSPGVSRKPFRTRSSFAANDWAYFQKNRIERVSVLTTTSLINNKRVSR